MTTREYFEKKNGFFKVQNSILMLPKEQAMMLSYLIDTEGGEEARRLDSDPDYFWANKEGFINNYLIGWSEYEISAALKGLKAAGYIDTKVINVDMRNRTYIKLYMNNIIRLDTIYELIQKTRRELEPQQQKELLTSIKNLCSGALNIDALEQQIVPLIHRY